MGIFDDVKEKFDELEDGRYLVRIDGFSREKTVNNTRPIKWELTLINEVKGRLPAKFSHIETDGGFRILMEEIKRLGYAKPKSPAELEDILINLKGTYAEIGLFTTDKIEGYREVRFIRKMI
ncbi:hypothetical protein A8F94_12100 [Bacillus sp. FJAT-27225]|uniref:hypothetical protein n=1 Tax=Bacillus sp. FJAT-27225 TaxID=1743144 RepID=UPI00080C24C3|nr:hypothetical protein [Bacillus sp. FJAT-27225]OCA85616.1 hypothetical protein A8F94_12100 [Bacillus sp. FJAT-27225]